MESEVFYSLNTEDIQIVAREEIGRELSKTEIARVQSIVSNRVDWYEMISQAIATEKIQ